MYLILFFYWDFPFLLSGVCYVLVNLIGMQCVTFVSLKLRKRFYKVFNVLFIKSSTVYSFIKLFRNVLYGNLIKCITYHSLMDLLLWKHLFSSFFMSLILQVHTSLFVISCHTLRLSRYSLNSGSQQVPTEMPITSYFKHKRITPHGTGTQMRQGLIRLMGTKLFSFYIK